MRTATCVFLLAAGASSTLSVPLDGKTIETLLNDTTVYGLPLADDSWRQSFSKGGETIYIDASGAKTFGSWMTRGDKYCSMWPPSEHWVCYGIEAGQSTDGKPHVSWISGGGGKRYDALLEKGLHVDQTPASH